MMVGQAFPGTLKEVLMQFLHLLLTKGLGAVGDTGSPTVESQREGLIEVRLSFPWVFATGSLWHVAGPGATGKG